jgi:hypothetical protein
MDLDYKMLCTPAKLYFALSVLSCLMMLYNRVPALAIFTKLIFVFLWTFILGLLCKSGFKSLSWFLVLLPFVLLLLGIKNTTFEAINGSQQQMIA